METDWTRTGHGRDTDGVSRVIFGSFRALCCGLSAEELFEAFLYNFTPVVVEIVKDFLDALKALPGILHDQIHRLIKKYGELCLNVVLLLIRFRFLEFFAEHPAFSVNFRDFFAVVIFAFGHFFPEFLEVLLSVLVTQFHQPLVFFRFLFLEIF